MEKISDAINILKKILSYDEKTLDRVKNLDRAILPLVRNYVTDGLLEDLKYIDTLSSGKKRKILEILLKYLENLNKPKESTEAKIEDLTYNQNQLSKINIDKLNFLSKLEKKALKKIKIDNVKNALFYLPDRYEDRRVKKILKVKDGETATLYGEVEEIKKVNKGKLKVEIVLRQDNIKFSLYYLYDKPFLYTYFRKGKKVKVFGKVNVYKGSYSIIQPEILKEEEDIIDNIMPVYSLRGDTTIKTTTQTLNHLRRGMFKIVDKFSKIKDYMPDYILKKYNFPSLYKAIKYTHFPQENTDIDILNNFQDIHQKRLIFDELFLLILAQKYRRYLIQKHKTYKIIVSENFIEDFEKNLPFELTEAQKRTIRETIDDLNKDIPMNRLVQGDVGSGKTVVATAGCLAAALNGFQSAVMAPTEILAWQHYKNFKIFLNQYLKDYEIAILTGSMKTSEKNKIYNLIKSGDIKIVIGTHTLLEEKLTFKNLALVVVDEQHRFGVEQRKALVEQSDRMPHVLVMTATPIPRTLTLANYGDLDISKLDQLPKGRKPVKTVLLFYNEREKLYEIVKEELDKGRQAFVVYPLIQESEKSDLKSAKEGYKHWKERFSDKNVLLLHGKMKQEEKDKVMEMFKEGKAHILVSTTVIEVGVDVPNATVMVIEESHRFGLSQIHQLRGRIGRGQYEGYCFLIAPSELKFSFKDSSKEKSRLKTLERLKTLVKTNNGFEIAEKDLELRGTGEITGTKQSGESGLSIADLKRDEDLLNLASKEAEEIIKQDPNLEKFSELKQLIFQKYSERFDLVNIA